MSGHETLNTHGRARLSFANEADIDEFVVMLEKYERGEITPDQWRGFRLLRGTYGQRQSYDASMLRVKIPQGVITSDQLGALAHGEGELETDGPAVIVVGAVAALELNGRVAALPGAEAVTTEPRRRRARQQRT